MLIIYLVVLVPALYLVFKILQPEMAKPALPPADEKPVVLEPSLLETLLAEKNKTIHLLETELKVFHAQISAFDKVKTVLEEEIQRLREQNRIFRSELGLPATQPKENLVK